MAEIIQLGGMDEEDEAYNQFLEDLKNDVVRAVFIVEKKDGRVAFGTNSTDKRDVVYDFFALQNFCQQLIQEG